METKAEILSGDAEAFLFRNSESSIKLLDAIFKGLSQNTIAYRTNTLFSPQIVFADGSGFTPHLIIHLLLVAEKQQKQGTNNAK